MSTTDVSSSEPASDESIIEDTSSLLPAVGTTDDDDDDIDDVDDDDVIVPITATDDRSIGDCANQGESGPNANAPCTYHLGDYLFGKSPISAAMLLEKINNNRATLDPIDMATLIEEVITIYMDECHRMYDAAAAAAAASAAVAAAVVAAAATATGGGIGLVSSVAAVLDGKSLLVLPYWFHQSSLDDLYPTSVPYLLRHLRLFAKQLAQPSSTRTVAEFDVIAKRRNDRLSRLMYRTFLDRHAIFVAQLILRVLTHDLDQTSRFADCIERLFVDYMRDGYILAAAPLSLFVKWRVVQRVLIDGECSLNDRSSDWSNGAYDLVFAAALHFCRVIRGRKLRLPSYERNSYLGRNVAKVADVYRYCIVYESSNEQQKQQSNDVFTTATGREAESNGGGGGGGDDDGDDDDDGGDYYDDEYNARDRRSFVHWYRKRGIFALGLSAEHKSALSNLADQAGRLFLSDTLRPLRDRVFL